MARVLIAEDEHNVRDFLAEALELAGHEVDDVGRGDAALNLLREHCYDVLLTDLRMPGLDGMGLLEAARRERRALQVIVLTAHGTVDSAVRAMKLGAFDYLQKPVRALDELRQMVARAAEKSRLVAAQSPSAGGGVAPIPELTWGDPVMAPVVDALRKVAATRATVLLTGQSGTGKEVAAQALHGWSDRAAGRFVAVNCAALSSTLLESELFGHEKGSFTGAISTKKGRFELAHRGTIFLDEIGEMPLHLQAKILRAIQERKIERVGSAKAVDIDVRIISATHRNLLDMVKEHQFREDLYYRLAVFPVLLPPLRDRIGDIGMLANYFLARACIEEDKQLMSMSQSAMRMLERYSFPGNVRELQNIISHAVVVCSSAQISMSDLPLSVVEAVRSLASQPGEARSFEGEASLDQAFELLFQTLDELPAMERVESALLARALRLADGNVVQAAKALGMSRATVYRRIERLGGKDALIES